MVSFDKSYLKFYLVLETSFLKVPLVDFIHQVLEAGVTAIQLRDKLVSAKERYLTGLKIKECFTKFFPLFIVNDNIDLAIALKASGVHLGIKDIPPKDALRLAPDLIIGYSCNTFEDCHIASDYAHYAGVGPVYNTDTKKDLRQVLGLSGLKSNLSKLSCPTVAIGGINVSNAFEVLNCGVNGLAISSCICASDEPYNIAKKITDKINYERV